MQLCCRRSTGLRSAAFTQNMRRPCRGCSYRPFSRSAPQQRGRHVRARAKSDDDKTEAPKESRANPLNPFELGRRSRQAVDDVWYQLTRMTGSRASFNLEDDLGADVALGEYQAPQAEFTNVLVVGGTGKVGRIVVRKLLLRGYSVRVMCRDSRGDAEASLPASVELYKGDVGDLPACLEACTGMDKVRSASSVRARSAVSPLAACARRQCTAACMRLPSSSLLMLHCAAHNVRRTLCVSILSVLSSAMAFCQCQTVLCRASDHNKST